VGFLVGFLTLVYFITCIVLIIVVLMQEPKGGGLSSAFGGAGMDTAFGASIGRKMSSFTVYLAIFFLILTIGLAILSKSSGTSTGGSIMDGVQGPPPVQPVGQDKQPPAGQEPQKGQPDSQKQQTTPDTEIPGDSGSGQQGTDKPEKTADSPAGGATGNGPGSGTHTPDPQTGE
jgi:preprotein translocase subunit SecG